METPTKNIYISASAAWVIATKDIFDAFRHKGMRTNLLLMFGFVVFFYWLSTPRPFDKRIDVVVYDTASESAAKDTNSRLDLATAEIADGYSFTFERAASLEEMKRRMRYEALGLVLPADFDRQLETGDQITLTGFILWSQRPRVAELEAKYSEKFSQLLDKPVRIQIGENYVIPDHDIDANMVYLTLFYIILFVAVAIVPQSMLEEKQTRTLDALLVSPAGLGDLVFGKALAGLFFVLVLSIWFYLFYWVYVVSWGMAVISFLLMSLFTIGLGLALGNQVKNSQHIHIATLIVMVLLLLPAIFSQETYLNPVLQGILPWFPSAALSYLLRLTFSGPAPLGVLLFNLSIALLSIVIMFSIVLWQVRRIDR